MKPTEAQRLALRTGLVDAIGEANATVLMEAMPPIDYDDLATKVDMDVLRTDMDARFAMVDARFVALSAELRGEMAELRGDLRGEMATLGGGLRSEMASQTRILVGTHIASMLGFAGLILGFG